MRRLSIILFQIVALSNAVELIKDATILQKNNLVTTVAEIGVEYSISFELFANKFTSGWKNILHFTQSGNNVGSVGDRIPAIFAHSSKLGSLHICSAVSGLFQKCVDSKAIPANSWVRITVNQRQNYKSEYVYQVEVNGIVELSEVNTKPQVFKDVKVFASNNWYNTQDGSIRNLVLQTNFKPTIDTLVKEDTVLKQNALVTTLKEIRDEYSIYFELFVNKFTSGWKNILHLTSSGNNVGSVGDRIPAIFAHTSKIGSISVCSAVNGLFNRCVDSKVIPTNTWVPIRVSQVKNVNREHVYRVEVNGVVELEEINFKPQLFTDVKVFTSDAWYNTLDGKIRNLFFKTEFEPKSTEGFGQCAIDTPYPYHNGEWCCRHKKDWNGNELSYLRINCYNNQWTACPGAKQCVEYNGPRGASRCVSDHQYAYLEGKYCCKYNVDAQGKPLDFHSVSCKENRYIGCAADGYCQNYNSTDANVCPFMNPFAFDNGKKCCLFESDWNGIFLKITSTSCKADHYVTCPGPDKCTTKPRWTYQNTYGVCPLSHKYSYFGGKFCCKHIYNCGYYTKFGGKTQYNRRLSHLDTCCHEDAYVKCAAGRCKNPLYYNTDLKKWVRH